MEEIPLMKRRRGHAAVRQKTYNLCPPHPHSPKTFPDPKASFSNSTATPYKGKSLPFH